PRVRHGQEDSEIVPLDIHFRMAPSAFRHFFLFFAYPMLSGMNKALRALTNLALFTGAAALAAPLLACRPTSHAAVPSALGVARPSADLEAVVDQPGPVVVETVVGAD